MLAKIYPDGRVDKVVIFDKVVNDEYHMFSTVGIDSQGYIHITGNMHHSPYDRDYSASPLYEYAWQYWVSNQPENIQGGFTFVGSDSKRTIPGTWISYPRFKHDNRGNLFITFRHRVHSSGWIPGEMAAGLARYDVATRNWKMLGGTNYTYGNVVFTDHSSVSNPKTVFWHMKGWDGTAYQGYRPDLFFDRTNRMHLVVGTNDGTLAASNIDTHVVYAYSDDLGETFHKANGSLIASLPMDLSTGDVVVGKTFSTTNGLAFNPHVGIGPDGYPIVSYWLDNVRKGYFSLWNPTNGWGSPKEVVSNYGADFFSDLWGNLIMLFSGKLRRSTDGGNTWREYTSAGPFTSNDLTAVDVEYLKATGNIRYFFYDGNSSLTSQVGSIRLTP